MRVARYYSNSDVRLEQMAVPAVGPGELLVRVEASGICGSDVMEWYRVHKAPLVLGHEIAGVVVETGQGVTKYTVGDRVAVSHHVPCNTCRYCLAGDQTACETLRRTNFDPGGFAEYVRVPAINADRGVYLLPEGVSFEDATFIEPLACVLRAQRKAGVRAGQSVLILGAGISGQLHVHLARTLGVALVVTTDLVPWRLEMARRLGADKSISAAEYSPEVLRELNGGYLADVVIVSAGATSAFQQALVSVERGGTVLFFAPTGPSVTLALSINDVLWRNEVTLTTSYAGGQADHELALRLIASRRVNMKEMITHRLGLAETGAGFRLVSDAGESMKVIVEPSR